MTMNTPTSMTREGMVRVYIKITSEECLAANMQFRIHSALAPSHFGESCPKGWNSCTLIRRPRTSADFEHHVKKQAWVEHSDMGNITS